MALDNNWIGYLTRTYNDAKSSILTRLTNKVPEITDYSESNLMIILISIFSGLVEVFNYYIDNIAREMYISTARRFSSMYKITRLIDYRIKSYNGASVDLLFTLRDDDDVLTNTLADVTIPNGTIVQSDSGLEFITQEDITILTGSSSGSGPAKQLVRVNNLYIGQTNGILGQKFEIPNQYQDGSAELLVGSTTWVIKETLGYSLPNDEHFIVDIEDDGIPYVKFGDGTYGKIPSVGQDVYISYYTTSGEDGNVSADTITSAISTLPSPGGGESWTNITFTNQLAASGGTGIESLEDIRKNAPISLRTLLRAVTKDDYKDLAEQVSGVQSAYAENDDNEVQIYIAPSSGGIASSQLLNSVQVYLEDKKMLTTTVLARQSGETNILLTITATAKFRRDLTITTNEVKEALLLEYGFSNSYLNRPIRKSDIIALVDNLENVDYVDLSLLLVDPYARPKAGLSTILDWDINILPGSDSINNWKLVWVNATDMNILLNDVLNTTLTIGDVSFTTISDGGIDLIDIRINSGPYSTGDEWTFVTYPYNENQEIEDYTIPVLKEANLSLTVNSQNI